jgi:hypothetical protein
MVRESSLSPDQPAFAVGGKNILTRNRTLSCDAGRPGHFADVGIGFPSGSA